MWLLSSVEKTCFLNLVFDRFSNNTEKSSFPLWKISSHSRKSHTVKFFPHIILLLSENSVLAENLLGKFLANNSAWKILLGILMFKKTIPQAENSPFLPKKMSVNSPITNTIRKQWVNSVTYNPYSRAFGGSCCPQRHN